MSRHLGAEVDDGGWRPVATRDVGWVADAEVHAHARARVRVDAPDPVGALLLARDALAAGGKIEVEGTDPLALPGLDRELGLRRQDDGSLTVLERPRSHQPLISLVVPAYRATWLRECLDSALAQTYPNCELVVADDCPDDRVAAVLDAHPQRDRIRVLEGPNHRVPDHADRSGRQTYLDVAAAAQGEYVKFVNDDDTLDPDCVRRFAACLDRWPDVTLVTSHRRLIDVEGNRLPDLVTTSRLFPTDVRLHGRRAVSSMVETNWNYLGEPTTAMWRATDAALSSPDFLSLAGRPAPGNVDMHLWAALGLRGDVVVLADTLSSMRMHPGQMQNRPVGIERGEAAQRNLARVREETGLFTQGAGLAHVALDAPRPWWDGAVADAVESVATAGDVAVAATRALHAADGDPTVLAEVAHRLATRPDGHEHAAEVAELALAAQQPPHPAAVWALAEVHRAVGDPARAGEALAYLRATCPRSRVVHDAAAGLAQGPAPVA